ncbi:MAG: alanine dehydrogenase [Leadbetterella sp.]
MPQSKSQFSPTPQESPQALGLAKQGIRIGIPKERDSQENRVALTPAAVALLIRNGAEVWVEKNAGQKANFQDSDYLLSGASIRDSHDEIFSCEYVIKINPLTPQEMDMIRPNATLFSSFQPNTISLDYIHALLKKKITCIGYEYLQDKVGNHTVVRSMSEIAGSAVLLIATEYLSSVNAGKGIVLGGITGLPPTQVLILGAGTVAEYAARSAMGLGASIKIFDRHLYRLRRIQQILGHNIYTSLIDEVNLAAAFKEADVVIGALRISDVHEGYKVPEEWIATMKPNSVIIDVSIDSGGTFETSKPTSHYSPVYKNYGVIHYCVPNIASRFAHTASMVLSNILSSILLRMLREGGVNEMIYKYPWFLKGVVTYKDSCTQASLAKQHNLKYKDLGLISILIN